MKQVDGIEMDGANAVDRSLDSKDSSENKRKGEAINESDSEREESSLSWSKD